MTNKKHRQFAVRLAALLLANICLLALAARPDLRAFAEGYEPIDLTETCTLTVYRIGQGSEYEEDAAGAEKIVADVYKIAEAEPVDGMDLFDLKLVEPFNVESVKTVAGISEADGDVLRLGAEMSGVKWTEIAQAAAGIVRAGNGTIVPTVKDGATGADTSIPAAGERGLDAGLYLLIIRTDDEDYWLEDDEGFVRTLAYSDRYNYTYAPQLLVLPYKGNTIVKDTAARMSDETAWAYDVSVYLKPETEPRDADLKIRKSLINYRGMGSATFVFQIEATYTKNGLTETVYSNVVSVEFSGDGTKELTLAGAIPVGARVTVTEIYSGPNSKLKSAKTITGVMTEEGLLRDEDNTLGPAEFVNEGGWKDGGEIVNHYVYKEEENADGTTGGDWIGPVNVDDTVTVE